MKTYRVCWETEVEASSPKDAAEQCSQDLFNGNQQGFTVQEQGQYKTVDVDLSSGKKRKGGDYKPFLNTRYKEIAQDLYVFAFKYLKDLKENHSNSSYFEFEIQVLEKIIKNANKFLKED